MVEAGDRGDIITFDLVEDVDGADEKLDAVVARGLLVVEDECVVNVMRMVRLQAGATRRHRIGVDFGRVVLAVLTIEPRAPHHERDIAVPRFTSCSFSKIPDVSL